MPNWAEQVTAIATAIVDLGLMSAIGAALYAGQQVCEARIGCQAKVASDFFRHWSEEPMVEMATAPIVHAVMFIAPDHRCR